ncbi:Chitinase class I [Pseudorhodobacter antarcticus]|uniref:Chitinase class I n=1 Tax=Pseudorhodobacter antarcticus TaxID=1077947 RepID=A0A1H8IGY1_9RHOB|nr:glycoside hydrolase family 19 protein [Pseudorhodobacter antarcticus]SEN67559.1 Chitinase class I [Pseudorhodobacter antarcticus]
MTPEFFSVARRSLFSGRLSQLQVDGLTQIVTYGVQNKYSLPDLAYVLATVHHETGRRMQPLREGFTSTNQGAIRAVTALYNKGGISTNYALPNNRGKSYYGRGLVQITWEDNYRKFEKLLGIPLVDQPDLSLEWPHALAILFIGMRDGMFRKGSLHDVPDVMASAEFEASYRGMINGDVRKYGGTIADYAALYFVALQSVYAMQAVAPAAPVADAPTAACTREGWIDFILSLITHFKRD